MDNNEQIAEAFKAYAAEEQAAYRRGANSNSSVPRMDTFIAGWEAAQANRPTPDECDASEVGHQFFDHCSVCGVDAHDWFNR